MEDVPINVATDSHRFVDRLRLFIRSRNLAYATEKNLCFLDFTVYSFSQNEAP